LRELREIWEKADPLPGPLVIEGARYLNIIPAKLKSREKILERLKTVWQKNKLRAKDFVDFEAALLRLAKNYLRKGKEFSLK